MSALLRRLQVGALPVTIISEGEGRFGAGAWTEVPAERWAGLETLDAEGRVPIGFNVVYVETPAGGVLLDPGMGEPSAWTRAFEARFEVERAGDVVDALAELGVGPEDVRAVVISHAHNDHFFGATVVRDGRHVPAFPNATDYRRAADWHHFAERQPADAPFHQILGALRAAGRLELVEGEATVAPGVTLLPTPGETPGHLSVRLESGGATAYYIGDLAHHVAEIVHPDWVPAQREAEPLLASRAALYREAAARGAVVIATHVPFPGAGIIESVGDGFRWHPIASA